MSPSLAKDEDLKKFPPTHLIFAGIDPLKDDYIGFFHRLMQNGVNVHATEFELMPHGFLSLYFPMNKGMN